ncbi:MAG: hypothetical protein ACI9YL_001420, partial [Luteibaculaceae bacterium]
FGFAQPPVWLRSTTGLASLNHQFGFAHPPVWIRSTTGSAALTHRFGLGLLT